VSKPWGLIGRDPLLKMEDLAEVAEHLDRTGGSTMARDEIGQFIQTKRAEKIIAAGFAPIDGVMDVSTSTTTNHAALLASQPTVSITKTAIKKTQTFTREQSYKR
jgi:hypothetical protein